MLDLCRSLDGLPLAIELAAARTKTLSVEEITRRLDDRFLVLCRPDQPQDRNAAGRSGRPSRWSYDLLFPDDQRGLWALATFAGGAPLPAVEFVLEALDVPAAAAIDVVGRLASRSLVTVDDPAPSPWRRRRTRRWPPVRYRLLDSIRAFALEAMTDAGAAPSAPAPRTPPGSPRQPGPPPTGCAAATRPSTSPSPGPSAPTSTRRWPGAPRTTRCSRSRIVNGFGWAWVVLGDSRGAQRILTALEAAGDAAPPRDRANALLLAAWIEASTGHLDLARHHIAAASELADATHDADLQARCSYYLAYVVSHHGEFRTAMELTDRSRAIYDTLDRPWDQAANALFAARAAISAGDEARAASRPPTRCSAGCARSRTRGCTFAARRCSASWPGSSTGSTTPSSTSAARPTGHDSSASSRPRPTRSRVWVERSARPATTTPAPPPWSSRSTRPRPPAMCASRRSPGCTWVGSCARSGRSTRARTALEAAQRLAPRRRRRRAGRAR